MRDSGIDGRLGAPHGEPRSERSLVREETLDLMLNADRALHDEVGRPEEGPAAHTVPEMALSSPREQAAMPIDLSNVDE